MKKCKMDDTANSVVLDEEIINLFEEVQRELISVKINLFNMYEKVLSYDYDMELVESNAKYIVYQAKYTEVLFKKLDVALDNRNENLFTTGKK